MRSRAAVRLGAQDPRVLVVPAGIVSTAGSEAAALAEESGLVPDPFQRQFVDLALAERADGSLAASTLKLIASRQNGKNVGVEIVELHDLVIAGLWIIHTAHLFTTTRESFGRLLALVEASPDIAERMTLKYASPMSGYEMQFRGGGRIKFIARSRTSGRGLSGDKIVFDEDQDLTDDAQGALLPTISADSDSGVAQAIYLGSAPGPTASVAHRLRKRGRNHRPEDDRFAYLEFSAEPDADLDDRDAWAQANPRLGRGMTEEFVQSERAAMSPEMFARERLSISPDMLDGEVVFGESNWERVCGDWVLDEKRFVYSVDANPERSMCSIGASDGVVVELLERRPGMDWPVARLLELVGKRKAPVAVDPAGPAGSFVEELERLNVEVVAVTGRDMAHACGQMFDAIVVPEDVTPAVRVRRDPRLTAAAAAAVKKSTAGDGFIWDRKAGGDVAPLVAVTVARYAALTAPKKNPVYAY
jgi:hypothetical protein